MNKKIKDIKRRIHTQESTWKEKKKFLDILTEVRKS